MARLLGGCGRIRITPAEVQAGRDAAIARRKAALPRGAAGDQIEISRMAELMAERHAANDNCTVDDLKRGGFTDADIAKYGDLAKARAAKLVRDQRIA